MSAVGGPHAARPLAPRDRGRLSWDRLHRADPRILLGAGILYSAVVLFTQARQIWFFGDDWAFLVKRSADTGILDPHNEHWSTLPLLAYRLMFHLIGVDHFVLWAMMPVALHVTISVLLYRLQRNHGVSPWPACLATLALVLMAGNIAEDLLWPFQIGFLGSALFGLGALSVYGPTVPRLASAWVLTVLSMMCSGMALPMLVWLGLLVLLSRGVFAAGLATIPPFVVYAAWYAGWGRFGSADVPGSNLLMKVQFAWAGISSTWQDVVGIAGVGGPFVVLLIVVVVLIRVDAPERRLALAGLGAMAVLYASIGLSRAALGVEGSYASRYAYFALMMTVPAFAGVLSWFTGLFAHRRDELVTAAVILVLMLAVTGTAQSMAFRESRQILNPGFKERALASAQLVRSGAPTFANAVEPTYDPDLTRDVLKRSDVADAFPEVADNARNRLQGAVTMQATASVERLALPTAAARRVLLSGPDIPARGCKRVAVSPGGYLVLPPTETGSQLALELPSPTMQVQMAGPRQSSDILTIAPPAGVRIYVASLSSEWSLRVIVPTGTRLCATG